jgi:hypothetical protein
MNPLNTPIYDLFYHLNTLNGLLFTLDSQLSNFEELYRESISKTSFEISIIFAGASLAIRDLTEWPKNGWARYYPSGKFSSKGEEYFELIRLLLARESAWTVSQAYEAFERFLKDIAATFLCENQDLAEIKNVEKFELDKKGKNLIKRDTVFWRTYVDHHYRTNSDKLKFLRKLCPDISKSETKNNRFIDLTEWFGVVEEIRHCATHSNFIIKFERMKNWSKAKQEILKKYFPGDIIEEGYQLNINSKDGTLCLELFSEYSFQMYKSLSLLKGYDWNILNKQKEKTVQQRD